MNDKCCETNRGTLVWIDLSGPYGVQIRETPDVKTIIENNLRQAIEETSNIEDKDASDLRERFIEGCEYAMERWPNTLQMLADS